MANIEIDVPGTTQLLLTDEAIARGALEAGVGFAASYPGTPATEILDRLAPVAKKMGLYAEWSINEKVAIEAAAAASYAGIHSLVSMKQNGVNVALDFLANLTQSGIGDGGLLMVNCDDPTGLRSTNEEDTRPVAKWLDVPMMEPGNFQEAKDMTRYLIELSSELHAVCILRSVTRLAHARGNVRFGELPRRVQQAHFSEVCNIFNPRKTPFTPWPPIPSKHLVAHTKLEKAREKFESSPFNWYIGPEKAELLIITSGNCWLYSQDAIKALKLENRVGILKLGTIWPLPEKFIEKNLTKSQRVLFVEEIEPFLEQSVMELVANLHSNLKPTFYGKRSGHVNCFGELSPDMVIKTVADILSIKYQPRDAGYDEMVKQIAGNYTPERDPSLCAGCPHRASYWAIQQALALDGRNGFVTGDVGCYAFGLEATGFNQLRTHHSMGSGAGIASGFGKLGILGFKQPVLAVCGDSTFFHATIPALINGVWNQSNFILVILDNGITAMTGLQTNPNCNLTAMGEPTKSVNIENLCRTIGAHVEICDPFDIENTIKTLLAMMSEDDGARVIIMRRPCELLRNQKEKKKPFKVHIDPKKCIGDTCGCDRVCTRVFHCPGLIWDAETHQSKIDEVLCAGCGVCADICPQNAIGKEKT